jgi:hypothetical protein
MLAAMRVFLRDQRAIRKDVAPGQGDEVPKSVPNRHTRNWEGKIKGRGTAARPTDCLHMGFRSTQQDGLGATSRPTA